MKIHFIGIGGIGISALAQYYLAKGHKISGSDLVKSEITDLLKKKGVKVYIGSHNSKCLTYDVKQVIYSPAVRKDNPEILEAKKKDIKIQSYPEALGKLTKKYFTIAVAGTHGKSTVTAMLALILIKAGFDPTVILGTKLREFGNTNFRIGGFPKSKILNLKSEILLIEADEWQASFLNYWPKIIVLTNIEREHLDYYKDLRHILRTYKEFISHLPRNGVLVTNEDLRFKIKDLRLKIKKFSLKQRGVKKLKKILKIPGKHNVSNASAALATARILKIPDEISFKALSEYKGAWRRFEIFNRSIKNYKLQTIHYKLISDYAHHPTEIKATLETARQKYLQKEIWCIFQPHQYQRTFYLFQDFVKVFRKAPVDRLIITDIYDVTGREVKDLEKKVNAKKLIEAIGKAWAIYLPKTKIINYLKKNLKGGEVVIIMGAGNIYKIADELAYHHST